MKQLFRPEVSAARHSDWMGTILLTTPKMVWPMTLLAAVIVATAVLFVSFGSYTSKQRVQGQLIPESGLLAVATRQAGTVEQLLVQEGQQVQAKQVVAVISSERRTTDQASLASAIREQLEYQRSRLQADLATLDSGHTQSLQDLRAEAKTIEQQLKLVDAQLEIRTKQLLNAQNLLQRIEQVEDQKYLSALQMQQYRDAVFEAETQLSLAQSQQLDYQQKLAAIRQQQQRLPLKLEDKRSVIQRNIASIEQSLLENESQRSSVIVAPRDGAISGLVIDVGQAVTAGQRLLNILPDAAPLLAELWVPGQAVGMLKPGQQVVLRYHAFPYQDFGLHHGEIIEIAGSTTTPERIQGSTGLDLKTPAYRVLARLEQQSVPAAQGQLNLRANMTLEADLLQQRQRLYKMLLPASDNKHSKKTRTASSDVAASAVVSLNP
jgi:membrane fusion protein